MQTKFATFRDFTIKEAFSVLNSDKTWVLDQSELALHVLCVVAGFSICTKVAGGKS